MNFSDKLRSLLEERGITHKLLANDLRIPVSTLGGYFQGTSEPDFQTLKIIAGYFEVTTDYLLGVSEQHRAISVVGLSEKQISILLTLADELRNK